VTAMTQFYGQNKKIITWALYLVVAIALGLWIAPYFTPFTDQSKPPVRLVESLVRGILVGSVYSLIALGIVIINKASGVFNFAHGMMMLFGAFIFYSFFSVSNINPFAAGGLALVTVLIVLTMNGWRGILDPRNLAIGVGVMLVLTFLMSLPGRENQLVRSVVGGVVGAIFIGLCVERLAIRPLIGQPLFASVLMTLAINEILLGITQMTWGSVELPLPVFAGLEQMGIPTNIVINMESLGGDMRVRTPLLTAFVLGLVAYTAFILFFRYTNVGLAMRATAENQQLAQSVGLRVRFILAVAWGIAALLAMTGGVLFAGATSLSLNMRFLALRAFPAVLLGGLESISGALVGGIVIGLVEELSKVLFGTSTQIGTEFMPYMVLMVVLVIRPDGLFGEKRIERI
jgi:branched-chain amino acid transport system permease protein